MLLSMAGKRNENLAEQEAVVFQGPCLPVHVRGKLV